MRVRYVTSGGLEEHAVSGLADLRARTDGFVWVDLEEPEDDALALLADAFALHPLVVEGCKRRNHVPTVHAYDEHGFVVLHAPLLGAAGHVHLLELDQVIGRDHLITVHGPRNPSVELGEALTETEYAARRIQEGRLRPSSPMRLSYAIGSAVARRQRDLVGTIAEKLPGLEKEVMAFQFREPEALLEQLFLIRHELITARTMAAQSHDVLGRLADVDRALPEPDLALLRDLADQFDRVRSVADGESQFLFGVIELYQTRVNTKMTVAMERLAVIAAVTLPITAIASIYGMNILDAGHRVELLVVLVVMAAMSFQLLRWARRQGWW